MGNAKRKVLVFIDWYLPGFRAGGPIRSCANLVSRMESHFHFKIVTGNTDLGESTPYPGIRTNEWNVLPGGEEVFYCSRDFLSHASVEKLIRSEKPDVIYLNSMFSQWFTLVPLLAARKFGKCKVVIAPRGMLSPGALGIKSGKKKLFLAFSRVMRLFRDVTWHASTELEVAEVKKMFGHHATVVHAMNLTALPSPPLPVPVKTPGLLKLVYIGRVSIVKNTLQTLEALAKLPPDCNVSFDIYGPYDDPAYLRKCTDQLQALPKNISARYLGPVDNETVRAILEANHFLFLLTFNENFGHAIAESLSAGRPVLISDRTPWRELERQQCGWDLDLFNEEAITGALKRACAMGQEEYNQWSQAASAYATRVIRNEEHIQRTLTLFS